MKEKKNIVVAITGASGSIYAKLLLRKLETIAEQFNDIAVVLSSNAKDIWEYELNNSVEKDISYRIYDNKDFTAPFASGSGGYNVMIIIPSSMGMIGRIAHGISDDLISRAADVMLKERKCLIIVPRESPYNLIHIENLRSITLAGGIICPATPSFYSKPQSIEEVCETVIDKVLLLAGLSTEHYKWGK